MRTAFGVSVAIFTAVIAVSAVTLPDRRGPALALEPGVLLVAHPASVAGRCVWLATWRFRPPETSGRNRFAVR